MLELKRSEAWYSPFTCVEPTTNLTAADTKRIAERNQLVDAAMAEMKKPEIYLKINKGVFKGSIFKVATKGNKACEVTLRETDYAVQMAKSGLNNRYSYTQDLDPSKGWTFTRRLLTFYVHFDWQDPKPIRLAEGTIFPNYLGGDVTKSISLLIDYDGPEVFQIDQKKRPLIFKDRLNQDVEVGDLVVVALNNGQGLDVCVIKGFSDQERVILESVETGDWDRISINPPDHKELPNRTLKIMKMPNSLRDTAMMMKLGRN